MKCTKMQSTAVKLDVLALTICVVTFLLYGGSLYLDEWLVVHTDGGTDIPTHAQQHDDGKIIIARTNRC